MQQEAPNVSPEEQKRFDTVFGGRWIAILFLVVLCVPAVRMLMPVHEDAATLRFDATKPPPPLPRSMGTLLRFPREYVPYFNQHFGFRRDLMALYARLKLSGIAVSDSQRVLVGKDGWLYFTGDNIVDDFLGLKPFTEPELEAWTRLLVARRDWLRARGIPYVFFIAPNTHTIYPEHLPSWIIRTRAPTRREQLIAYLKAHSDVDVLDMAPPLLAAKQKELVYYRTDTHWNMVGAFTVYQEISAWMTRHFPEWRSFGPSDFERTETPGWHGALGYMLGAPELATETRPDFVARMPGVIRTDGAPLPQDETADAWTVRPVVVRESDDGEIPNAVIFRDSQMAAPAQFLSRHFRRTVLVWSNTLDAAIIEREHPSVVIQELVERTLTGAVPVDPRFPP
jgi:alginate O-acetyltransferase complex protein AlgJ